MEDEDKTSRQLIDELTELRQRLAELEAVEAGSKRAEERILYFNEVLQLLRNLNKLIVRIDSEPELVQEVCNELTWHRPYKLAWIGLTQDDSYDVLPVAWAGFEDDYLSSVKITWDDSEYGQGPTGTAIKTGQPNVMQDILNDPRYRLWREQALKRGYRSSAGLPLILGNNNVIGTLNVYSERPNAFDSTELDLLVDLARDISVGIDKIRQREKRKQAEEALRQSEAKYSALVERSNDLIIIVQDGLVKFANAKVNEIIGFSLNEVIGRPFVDLISTEYRELVADRYKRRMSGEEVPDKYEIGILDKDGRQIVLEVSASIVQYEGRPADMSIVRDITERKRAEENLKMYQHMVESAHDAIFFKDLESRYIIANAKTLEALGLSREEVSGKNDYELMLNQEEARKNVEDDQLVFKIGKPTEITKHMTSVHGDEYWFNAVKVPQFDDKGGIIGLVGIARDITERKRAEKALRESEENFRHSLNDSPLGVRIVSADGETLYANQAILDIYGYASIKELTTTLTKERYTPESYTEHQIRKEKRGGGEYVPSRYDISIVRKDGEIRHLEVLRKQVLWNGKKQFQVVYQDITERKQLEEERQRVEKLESIGTLAAGIAHDFNNLLTGIMGNISLAKRHIEPEGKALERLEEAEKASVRARDLTHQLLTFARGGAPVRKTISIGELIRESASFALRGSKVRPEFTLPDDLWTVEADEGQINQVISNIVINADQAMPQGGVINIEAKNLVIKSRKVLPLPIGKYVEIAIKDRGVGISKEHLARIFDPFFTTKQKGSGLGLATAYSIINNHGGYITVESKLGVGTTLYVYLPASKVTTPIEEEAIKETVLVGRGRILVMDDEESIRELLYAELTETGYDVELANDGTEAIARYVEAKEAGQPFDAAILDLTVPGGMGGKETIKKLLEIDPKLKAIVSSGYATDPIMSEYKKCGFSAVVPKPYSVSQLEKTLRSVLKEKS